MQKKEEVDKLLRDIDALTITRHGCWRWDEMNNEFKLIPQGTHVYPEELEGLIPSDQFTLILHVDEFTLACRPLERTDTVFGASFLEGKMEETIKLSGEAWAANREHVRNALPDWLQQRYGIKTISIAEAGESQA